MTDASSHRDELSPLAVGVLLLREKWRIARWTLAGAILATATVITNPATYLASASFASQGNEGSRSSLASLAGQFGVQIPTSGQSLSPEYYARLVKTRTLLSRLAEDTLVVAEEGGRRTTFMDLMKIPAQSEALREDLAVEQLTKVIGNSVSKQTGIVEVTARTRWRSVSIRLVQLLIDGVDDFNQLSRQSQAGTERRFVEGRLAVADSDLRNAEERIEQFLRNNRQLNNSPELTLQRDRLERAVSQRQQVYTTLLQSYEDARIREVRDTPLITVIEAPTAPMRPEPRGRAKVALLGIFLGGFIGVVLVVGEDALRRKRRIGDHEADEFVSQLDQLTRGVRRPYQWVASRVRR